MIPLLPSNDLDDVLPFYLALGFRLTYRQARPNPCLGVTRGDGFDLQFFGMPGFDPEQNYSSVIVAVEDTQALYDELAAGLRAEYGKLPISGLPRITRPRRKQGTSGGFSVVDPAGNWLRIASTAAEQDTGSRFERVLLNAARQGDSHGDVGAAIAVLEAGLRRHADATDQEKLPVLTYLAELLVRDGSADRARGVLTEIDALDVDRSSVTEELGELRSQLAG
ncbi:hypothetical protein FB561_2312 [Kribbella amoyensis]|uniref:VOC family protein n=2 Tax=Kribbella amoyensis TaxID=996641 RepID=A0A561BQN7_9ACTN|nr:hypothetical protein FB561_2312 [Kribbella amoyensis]